MTRDSGTVLYLRDSKIQASSDKWKHYPFQATCVHSHLSSSFRRDKSVVSP